MITIRLQDRLPREFLERLEAEADEQRRRKLAQRYLDRWLGNCVLRRPKAEDIVRETL